MNFTRIVFAASIVLFAGCDHVQNITSAASKKIAEEESLKPKPVRKKKEPKRDGLVVSHRKDGKVMSEINMKDGNMHGLCKYYFPSGNIHTEYLYDNGKLHGELKQYYENGQPYKVVPYTQGKIDGIEKTYKSDGKLLAEVPYKDGQPGIGVKEYGSKGLFKNNPTIVVEEIDHMLRNNEYILKIYLSDKSTNVEFYLGELTEGKYLNEKLTSIITKRGVGEMKYTMPPNSFIMDKLNIVAKRTSYQGVAFVTQTKFNVSIENK